MMIKSVFKEFRISIIVSCILALVNGVRIYLVYSHNLLLAVTIALSIITTVIMSKLIGAVLPMCAEKLGIDPALAASPVMATIIDSTSLLMYFNIAMVIFGMN